MDVVLMKNPIRSTVLLVLLAIFAGILYTDGLLNSVNIESELSGNLGKEVLYTIVNSEEPSRNILKRSVEENQHSTYNMTYTVQETFNHQYYQEYYYSDQEANEHYWVDMDNESIILSRSYRKATVLDLPYNFPFYGHQVNRMIIATGGFIFVGEQTHKMLTATEYIAPLMANFDTNTTENSAVRHKIGEDVYTVEWNNVHLNDNPEAGNFTFQLSIFVKTGKMAFVYRHIPIPLSSMTDNGHPVKAGAADAYYVDEYVTPKLIKRVIYQYHAVEVDLMKIKSFATVILKPLPTCNMFTDCESCVTQNSDFNCSWCPTIQMCSSGIDRHRHKWTTNGCEENSLYAPCQNGGSCPEIRSSTQVRTSTQVECQCPSGFTGKYCEQAECNLEGASCLNGGICTDPISNGAFKCVCRAGWTGPQCQLAIDMCETNPCHNGGTCQNSRTYYTCKCPPNYYGIGCDLIYLNSCSSFPCKNGGLCRQRTQQSSFTCECLLGFTGSQCEDVEAKKNVTGGGAAERAEVPAVLATGSVVGIVVAIVLFIAIIALVAVYCVCYSCSHPSSKRGIFLIEFQRQKLPLSKDQLEEQCKINIDEPYRDDGQEEEDSEENS